jgi:hypothetical protein
MKAAGDAGALHDGEHGRVVAHLPGAEGFAEVGVEVQLHEASCCVVVSVIFRV